MTTFISAALEKMMTLLDSPFPELFPGWNRLRICYLDSEEIEDSSDAKYFTTEEDSDSAREDSTFLQALQKPSRSINFC